MKNVKPVMNVKENDKVTGKVQARHVLQVIFKKAGNQHCSGEISAPLPSPLNPP